MNKISLTRISSTAVVLLLAVMANGAPNSQSSPLKCPKEKRYHLIQAIEMHNDHAYRLNRKFKDVWYYQGEVPQEISREGLVTSMVTFFTLTADQTLSVATLLPSVEQLTLD